MQRAVFLLHMSFKEVSNPYRMSRFASVESGDLPQPPFKCMENGMNLELCSILRITFFFIKNQHVSGCTLHRGLIRQAQTSSP